MKLEEARRLFSTSKESLHPENGNEEQSEKQPVKHAVGSGDNKEILTNVARRAGEKYAIFKDADGGLNAVLLFGKYDKQDVGAMSKQRDKRGYLKWMLKQDFPPDLLDVVRSRLNYAESS